MKIGDKVRATMDGKEWLKGEFVEELDLLVPYKVKLETGEIKYFAHVEIVIVPPATLELENEMIISKEKKEEFEAVVDPVIKWLNDNCHPHVHVVINCTVAELSEGVCVVRNEKHVRD